MRGQRGLTLVELLVALGIFSLVSAASLSVLSLALSGQDQLRTSTEEVRRLERMRTLLRGDLMQLADRPVRNAEGQSEPKLIGGAALSDRRPGAREAADETVLIRLTRGGWTNPGALRPRAELQRVTYLLKDGALVRRVRPFLDASPGTPAQDQVLLDGLTAATVAFHDGQAWQDGFASEEGGAPLAVRVEIDAPALGLVQHDFLAGPR